MLTSFVFVPSGVVRSVTFDRSPFGDDTDADGALDLTLGYVKATGAATEWQAHNSIAGSPKNTIGINDVVDLRDSFADVLRDITENNGGTILELAIGSTGQKLVKSGSDWVWGAYTIQGTAGIEAHHKAAAQIVTDYLS